MLRYRWGNLGLQKGNQLPSVTKVVNGKSGTTWQNQVFLIFLHSTIQSRPITLKPKSSHYIHNVYMDLGSYWYFLSANNSLSIAYLKTPPRGNVFQVSHAWWPSGYRNFKTRKIQIETNKYAPVLFAISPSQMLPVSNPGFVWLHYTVLCSMDKWFQDLCKEIDAMTGAAEQLSKQEKDKCDPSLTLLVTHPKVKIMT